VVKCHVHKDNARGSQDHGPHLGPTRIRHSAGSVAVRDARHGVAAFGVHDAQRGSGM
jgi:hypothetical protein